MCFSTFDLENVTSGRVLRYHSVQWFFKSLCDSWTPFENVIKIYPLPQNRSFSPNAHMLMRQEMLCVVSGHSWSPKAHPGLRNLLFIFLSLREVEWHEVESWKQFPTGRTSVRTEGSDLCVNLKRDVEDWRRSGEQVATGSIIKQKRDLGWEGECLEHFNYLQVGLWKRI